MVGISHCIKVLDDLEAIIIASIELARGGSSVMEEISAILSIIGDAPAAFPEVLDIDSAEAGQLMARSYELVKNVIKKAK